MQPNSPVHLGILISGTATTANTVLQATKIGNILHQLVVPKVIVASSDKHLKTATTFGWEVPVVTVSRKQPNFGNTLLAKLKQHDVDTVAQLGWLLMTPSIVAQEFAGRIFNQHPGPPEYFGGKGMYGKRVAFAMLVFNALTGLNLELESALHHVSTKEVYDDISDGGLISVANTAAPIVSKRTVSEIRSDPTEIHKKSLTAHQLLLPHEHANVVNVLKHLSEQGQLPSFNRDKPLITNKYLHFVERAKQISIQLNP